MFFAKSTGGFYDAAIHGDNIPTDAVEITNEEHAALLDAQSNGKVIQADKNGNPVAVDPPPPTQEELELIAAAEAKKLKNLALSTITVTTSSGKVFDGNETARINMLSALQASEFLNQTQAGWKLADNSVALVTVAELKEALALAIQRVGEIVTA